MTDKIRINVMLSEDLNNWLTIESDKSGMTKSSIVNAALIDFLKERKEDYRKIEKQLNER